MNYLIRGILLLTVLGTGIVQAATPAPVIKLKNLDGKTGTLSDYRGEVVYLDFWATWCAPCRKSFPWMNQMLKKYQDRGLRIIAISLDDNPERVKTFLKKLPASFDIMIDPTGKSADTYKVRGMPSSYLIDRKGNLVFSHAGFRMKQTAKLEEEIRKALRM